MIRAVADIKYYSRLAPSWLVDYRGPASPEPLRGETCQQLAEVVEAVLATRQPAEARLMLGTAWWEVEVTYHRAGVVGVMWSRLPTTGET